MNPVILKHYMPLDCLTLLIPFCTCLVVTFEYLLFLMYAAHHRTIECFIGGKQDDQVKTYDFVFHFLKLNVEFPYFAGTRYSPKTPEF